MGCKRLNTDFFNFLEIVHSKKSASEEKKRINYYPFGLQHKGYNNVVSANGNSTAQRWDFLGQERQEELGLNWVSFRHRNGDPAIGRFFGVDPVSEDYLSISTYQFAHNNPVWKIELEGLEGVETSGHDIPNSEPVRGHTNVGSMAIPIGDGTGNHGSSQTVNTQSYVSTSSSTVGGYLGQALEEAVTAGIQWIAGEIAGSDVSKGASENIQTVANVVILVTSKGKNTKAATDLSKKATKQVKKMGDVVKQKKNTAAKDASKNSKHGDSGRSMPKAEKQVEQLEGQMKDANKKTKKKLKDKIRRIKQDAQKKAKGEEHSRVGKQ